MISDNYCTTLDSRKKVFSSPGGHRPNWPLDHRSWMTRQREKSDTRMNGGDKVKRDPEIKKGKIFTHNLRKENKGSQVKWEVGRCIMAMLRAAHYEFSEFSSSTV